jgi:hypothetical protein
MSQTVKFIVVVILIGIIGVLFFKYKNQDNVFIKETSEVSTVSPVKSKNIYTNKTYNFSFEIPKGMEVLENNKEYVSVGNKTSKGFSPLVDIRLVQSPDDNESGYEEFALDEARLSCSASTGEFTLFCTEISDLVPFSTESSIKGEEFYTVAEIKNSQTGLTLKGKRGPYISFNSTKLTPRMSVLFVSNPISKEVTKGSTDLVISVAKSIVFK